MTAEQQHQAGTAQGIDIADAIARLHNGLSAFQPAQPFPAPMLDAARGAVEWLSAQQVDPVFGALLHLLGLQLELKEAAALELRMLPSGADCTWRVPMTPTFQVVFKDLLAGGEQALSTRFIQAAPDLLVTLLLAQRAASQQRTRIWLHADDHATAGIHVHFAPGPRSETAVKESPSVLIIEDTKPIGLLLELYLRLAGFQPIIANDGLSGMAIAREQSPDLITLDVMMPGKDGWEVLRELKADPATAHIPVIIISVLTHRQIGFDFGAADYLPKPVVREDLIASARRLTARPEHAKRSLAQFPERPALIAPADAVALRALWEPSALRHSMDPGHPRVIEELLNLPALPDAVFVDCRSSFLKALSTLHRIRLSDAFDRVPVALLGTREQVEYLRPWHRGIVDAMLEERDCTREGVAAALGA
jgi:DNA-binding response OmpR family regulator